MTLVFFLKHGAKVEWPVPEADAANFSLQVLALNVRATGFFGAQNCYIPGDEIACIGMDNGGVKVRMPQHAAPAAKQ